MVATTDPTKAAPLAEKAKGKDLGAIAPPASGCPLTIDPQRFFTMLDNKSKDPAKARQMLKAMGGLDGLASALQSSLDHGPPSNSVQQRRQWLGENCLPPLNEKGFCDFLIESFDEMMRLLAVLGAVALAIQLSVPETGEDEVHYSTAWIDGTFILVAVTLVVLITSINNYKKEVKFRELDAISDRHNFRVIRQGNPKDAEGRTQPVKIDHTEIVVGDVVMLNKGDLIPADGVFISGHSIVDESALTGENDLKDKTGVPQMTEVPESIDPFVISGTSVTGGLDGKYLVCAVGERSYSGHLEMGLRKEVPPTPLQEKLDDLAGKVGWLGIIVAVLLFVTLGVCNAINTKVKEREYDGTVLLDYAIISVSIIVVAVPEGLPLSVTIALAYSMTAMQKDNNMVRSLMACETMGAATNICSDKTGTLTQNEMIMTQVNISKVELQSDKDDPSRKGEELGSAESDAPIKVPTDRISKEVVLAFVEAALYNCEDDTGLDAANEEEIQKWITQRKRAHQSTDGPAGPNGKGLLLWNGNKTEVGIVRWCRRVWPGLVGSGDVKGDGWAAVKKRAKQQADRDQRDPGHYVRQFPHDSVKKSSTTVVNTAKGHDCCGRFNTGKIIQFTKGAPERIIKACSHWVDQDNTTREMTPADMRDFEGVYERYSEMALRGIAVAYCELDPGDSVEGLLTECFDGKDPYDPDEPALTLLGICGIQDPPREEVPGAVRSVQDAGVIVRMCTGDNTGTGTAIAQECGLIDRQCYQQWLAGQKEKADLIAKHGKEQGEAAWHAKKLPQKYLAMTGGEFRRMFCDLRSQGDAGMREFYERLRPSNPDATEKGVRVLARCTPLEKQLFVGSLMMLGEVVAVTGDGCNDAPALKLADVGFAMEAGHQVAKKASKIVLLDNNFVSVVKACKWGRNVNDSIRKFLQFQFTVNVVLLVITFIGAVADVFMSEAGEGKPPLAAIHLLWANLIMDTMAAMALSTEKPHPNLISAARKPVYRRSPLLSRKMWRFVWGGAIFQLAVTLILIFAGKQIFQVVDYVDDEWYPRWNNLSWIPPLPPGGAPADALHWPPEAIDEREEDINTVHRTITFNIFIYMQVFNWFSARKLFDEINMFEGLGRSPMFLPIVFFTAGFQAFMVEVAQKFLETKSIGAARWGISLAIAFMMWPWMMIVRLIPINEAPLDQKTLEQEAAELEEEEEKEEKKGGKDEEGEEEEEEEDEEPDAAVKLRQIREVYAENEKHDRDERKADAEASREAAAEQEAKWHPVGFKSTEKLGYPVVSVQLKAGVRAVHVWRVLLLQLGRSSWTRKLVFRLPGGGTTESMDEAVTAAVAAKSTQVEYSAGDEYSGSPKTTTLLDHSHRRGQVQVPLYEGMPLTRLVGQLWAAASAGKELQVMADDGVMARTRTLTVERKLLESLLGDERVSAEGGVMRIVGEVEGWRQGEHGLQPGVCIRKVNGRVIRGEDDIRAGLAAPHPKRQDGGEVVVEVVHIHEDELPAISSRLHTDTFPSIPVDPNCSDSDEQLRRRVWDSFTDGGECTFVSSRRTEKWFTVNKKGVYQGWFTGGKMPSKWAKPPSKYMNRVESLKRAMSGRRRSSHTSRPSRAQEGSSNEPAV
eukprot:TRINITY_DN714_c0_g1_i1.p1 TRINITY_DN714_c0_g1~~TRINITY_DN714_c0_g1_i1.p1  ORF type:complete len:1762 (+),score=558.73 TRINITY_DN714_c0_g1_i1:467-5287(+)